MRPRPTRAPLASFAFAVRPRAGRGLRAPQSLRRGARARRVRSPRPLKPRRSRCTVAPLGGGRVDAAGPRWRSPGIPLKERVMTTAADLIALEERYGAHNYHPLDVVITRAEGCWVWDVEGKRYLDFLAAYSAVNQGHCHPRIVKAAGRAGRRRVTLTSRAFRNDQLGPFCAGDLRADRLRARAADEHRRRGGRDRDQGGPQVGLHGQGRPRGPGRDPRLRRQLPRPHHDHRRLLHRRPVLPGRLRPLHARLQDPALRRRRGGRGGDEPERRGDPGRADPGRGRHLVPPDGLPRAAARARRPPPVPADVPTRSSPASAAPASCSPASTRASAPTW